MGYTDDLARFRAVPRELQDKILNMVRGDTMVIVRKDVNINTLRGRIYAFLRAAHKRELIDRNEYVVRTYQDVIIINRRAEEVEWT